MTDLDALLAPVTPESPAGPDLSYAPDRQSIEQAFDLPPEEVDWERTIGLIVAQAQLTRDAWLAVYLARAGAHAGSLDAVENGCLLLAGLFEGFWTTLHPDLEDYGIEGRKGVCESLVRIGGFLAPLRRVPLVRHPRLGEFSGADFVRFAADGPEASGYGQFRAAIADTAADRLEGVIEALNRIRGAIERVDEALSAQAGELGQTGTNFRPTYDALEEILAALQPFAAQPEQSIGDSRADQETSVSARTVDHPTRVSSRSDAERALDAVIEYYVRAEPSSPIPVALGRIKGWITMDFMSILNDIAPGSVTEATSVLRTRSRNDTSDLM